MVQIKVAVKVDIQLAVIMAHAGAQDGRAIPVDFHVHWPDVLKVEDVQNSQHVVSNLWKLDVQQLNHGQGLDIEKKVGHLENSINPDVARTSELICTVE